MALRNNFAKKCLECRSKWAKLNYQQAEIAKNWYENIDDGSITSYMEKNPDSRNLEWYHHIKCWKWNTFCDEGKIRRQQRKEGKGEGTSSNGPTSTEVSPEVKPPCHKETRMCFQRYVLFVGETLLGFH